MKTQQVIVGVPYDKELLLDQIRNIEDSGKLLRLEISNEVDKEIIWAASYHAKNVLVIKADVFRTLDWISIVANTAKRCGFYFILKIYPIVPKHSNIVKVLQVLEAIVPAHFEVEVEFARFNKVPIGYSQSYYEKVDNGWECSEGFKLNYLETLRFYLDNYSIKVKCPQSGH